MSISVTQLEPSSSSSSSSSSEPKAIMGYTLNTTSDSSHARKPCVWAATQQALSLPEILSIIFSSILDAGDITSLRHCALVNSTWYREAINYLWSDPCSGQGYTIPKMLSPVTNADMRQVYANLIRSGTLSAFWNFDKEHVEMSKNVLPGLEFRKLKSVTVHVRPFDEKLPSIEGATGVKHVTIKSQYWDYSDGSYFQYVEREGMGKILDQIPEVFPNVEIIEFRGNAEARRKHLNLMADRLPKLKTLDLMELWIIES